VKLFKKILAFVAGALCLPAALFFPFFGAACLFVFLGLFLLLLAVFVGQRSQPLFRVPAFVAGIKFALSMMVMTVICMAAWGNFVADKLYFGADGFGGMEYVFPGNWVENWDGHPIEVVPQIIYHSLAESDEIKAGWSVAGLWCLWFALFGISLGVSSFAAWMRWWELFRRHGRSQPGPVSPTTG